MCPRFLDAHAVSESTRHVEEERPAVLEERMELGGKHPGVHHHRNPQVGTEERVNPFEAVGSDTDDIVAGAVDADRLTHDVGILAEAAQPKLVAQDCDGIRALSAILLGKYEPPHGGLHAQHAEVVSRHRLGEDLLGLVADEHARGKWERPRDQTLEDFVLVPVVLVVRERDCGQTERSVRLIAGEDRDHLAGIFHGKGIEKDRVHQRKDGRVGADPEGQR